MNVVYTIIIPHKNIPDLLQRCLDSIPQREDVQVIVVDDKSDPKQVDFSHFPGSDRPDVELYFTHEGKGAGYARNIGLKHVRGKWVLFADADDFFHEGMLQMLDKWVDSDNAIIYFETDSVDSETLKPVENRLMIHIQQTTKKEMENDCRWMAPWGKMIRAELLREHCILFEEIRWSNDVMFSTYCSYYAGRNINISEDILYCATLRENSLTSEKKTEEHSMCRLETAIRYEQFVHKHNMRIFKYFSCTSFSFQYLGKMHEHGEEAYRKAKIYYLKNVCFSVFVRDFIQIIKFKIRNMLKKNRRINSN